MSDTILYNKITKELRCTVCQHQTLSDSETSLAVNLRREIFEQVRAGKTEEEILSFVTTRYGDFVLYQPPFRADTYLLWFGPILMLIFGIFIIIRQCKKSC